MVSLLDFLYCLDWGSLEAILFLDSQDHHIIHTLVNDSIAQPSPLREYIFKYNVSYDWLRKFNVRSFHVADQGSSLSVIIF